MRFLLCLLLACVLATQGYSQKLTLHVKNAPLQTVFSAIRKQAGFIVFCDYSILEKAKPVTVSADEMPLETLLKTVLTSQELTYNLEGKTVVITERKPAPATVTADGEVIGRVANERGEPMPGVSILVSGKPHGTETDAKGFFRVHAGSQDTLLFSYVGYETQRLAVKKQAEMEITLRTIAQPVSEVVVVGYGKQKKTSVVGAVSTVAPAELEVPGSQLTQAFAGRISGVIAVQNSGEPKNDAATFWIRGVATLGNTNPLVFLDGIEISIGDLNSIDPVNIEGFSVLKDASATALYGARGANGVILITTKRGRNLVRPNITGLVENSFVSPTRLPRFADAVTYMNEFNEARSNNNPFQPVKYTQDKINGTEKNLDPYIYPDVDWYKTLFKDVALRQHANANIRGGSASTRYYMGGSYYRDEGILRNAPNNNFNSNILNQRYNFINNVSASLGKTTEVELNINADFYKFNGPATSASSIFSEVMNSNPVHFPVTFPRPDSASNVYFGNSTGGFLANNTFYNPYADMVSGYTQSFESTVLATLRLNQKLDFVTRGLSANVLASFKNYSFSSITRSYTPYFYQLSSYGFDSTAQQYNYQVNQIGSGGQTALSQSGSTTGDRTLYLQAMLNYERAFGKHDISGLLVYQQKEYNINSPGADITASLPNRNQGISGRVTYGYDNRYFIESNFGYTGSENFAPGHRWGFFPSVGAGYVISNERFFAHAGKIFSLLKLRASYGLAGNDQINASTRFPYTSLVNLNNSANGYTFGQNFNNTRYGVSIDRYANPDITWEKAHKLNIGMDMEVLHQLTLNIDFFREKRDNIFQQRATVPSTLGIGTSKPYANIDKVQNKGIDLTAAYSYTVNKNLLITARGTFTYAKNKVLYYDEPQYMYPYLSAVGRPVNQLRGLVADRLFIDNKEIANSPVQTYTSVVSPGDIRYKDISNQYDHLKQVDDNDRVPMGYPSVPEITYGFGFNVIYKRFDVGVFFQGIAHNSFFINGIDPFGPYENNLFQAIASSHWSQNNQNLYAFYPRLSETSNPNNSQYSSWWLRNGAFMRLKNVEIGYAPTKILRVYANGSNLLTFSRFKLWDPELSANSGGSNGLGYPPERVINIGLQVNLK